MTKFLVLIVVILIVYAVVKNFTRRASERPDGREVKHSQRPNSEDMVRCAYCGVHLPKSESTLSKGNYFCSNQHRLLFTK